MALIEFKDVSKIYSIGEQQLRAVDEASFGIEQGEFAVILGPSGAGKSTILNLLGGMDFLSEGQITVAENDISGYKDDELTDYRAEHVGFVFQFYNLIPTLTALENVSVVKDVSSKAMHPEQVLDMVGLQKHHDHFPSQLSGGEQQRVSIARAIAKNPTMLLCDEPTGALDSDTGTVILSMLQNLSRERNTTVIIVTHNAAIAQAADKVIKVKNGRVEEIAINESPANIEEVNW